MTKDLLFRILAHPDVIGISILPRYESLQEYDVVTIVVQRYLRGGIGPFGFWENSGGGREMFTGQLDDALQAAVTYLQEVK